jgi:SAM-dependent methyltransferase
MKDHAATRLCPYCEGTRATRIAPYSKDEWDVVACDTCGFVYLANPASYEALTEDLAWEKTYAEKAKTGGSSRFSALNRRLRRALGHKPGERGTRVWARAFGKGRVLDIGCGEFLRPPEPMIPYGIELSTALHARIDPRMRARGGYCIQAPGAEGIWQFDANFFTGVIMSSYLEHEVEAIRVLKGAHRALVPGGKVFVRVPNFGSLNRRVMGARWCGFRYPDHVNYFTPTSLRALAAKAGFSMQIVNRVNLWLDDNIQALLIKS